jgi:hypothetical protein
VRTILIVETARRYASCSPTSSNVGYRASRPSMGARRSAHRARAADVCCGRDDAALNGAGPAATSRPAEYGGHPVILMSAAGQRSSMGRALMPLSTSRSI